jgi:hypothetical protein
VTIGKKKVEKKTKTKIKIKKQKSEKKTKIKKQKIAFLLRTEKFRNVYIATKQKKQKKQKNKIKRKKRNKKKQINHATSRIDYVYFFISNKMEIFPTKK